MSAAAKKRPAAEPASLGPVVEILFDEIVSIDPCNARHIEPPAASIAEFAAELAAKGLLNPLIVRGAPRRYRVLAGGRRWRALKLALGPSGGATKIRVRVFVGSDDDAAALSLAENIDREDLHPLEEADRVAELAADESAAALARKLGRPERWVKERLALSNLPEVARNAWTLGRIGLAQARLLTSGDPKAVEALFASSQRDAILSDPRAIRRALGENAVSADSAVARFVGLDAYVAEGGATREDLFDDKVFLTNPHLLNRLSELKRLKAGERLGEEEGWGYVISDPGEAALLRPVQPDHLDVELTEIDTLEAQLAETPSGDARAAEIEARLAEIEGLGVLRAIPQAERARYGVYLGVDHAGRLEVQRGLIVGGGGTSDATPADAAASEPPAEAADPSPASLTKRPTSPRRAPSVAGAGQAGAPRVEEPVVLPIAARRIAEMAGSKAIAELLLGEEVDDFRVLVFALAAMLCKGRSPIFLGRMQGPGGSYSHPARHLAKGLPFALAAREAEAFSFDEVSRAFREIVAGAVDLRRSDEDTTLGFVSVLTACLGGKVRERLVAGFDYAGFFAEAGPAWSFKAILESADQSEVDRRQWQPDEMLAAEAAVIARAKCWLPEFLRSAS